MASDLPFPRCTKPTPISGLKFLVNCSISTHAERFQCAPEGLLCSREASDAGNRWRRGIARRSPRRLRYAVDANEGATPPGMALHQNEVTPTSVCHGGGLWHSGNMSALRPPTGLGRSD